MGSVRSLSTSSLQIVISGIRFTKAYNWNIVKIRFVVIMNHMIQLGHNLAHATTVQLSWHVQNYDLIGSLFSK